jgi:CBS domain-containing protein
MSLITAAHSPPLAVSADTTVFDACQQMSERNVGAVAVVSTDNTPIGIVTERDVIRKVVTQKLDPERTKLSQVMTSPCLAIPSDRSPDDALSVMVAKSVHHLALIDEDRKLIGMVSYRTLLRERIDSLNAEVDHLSAYMGDDGIGGG